MADYYSILKKTVSGLPRNTAENRNIVYAKARQAIDRQLRSLTPPPAEEAIAKQMKLLEQAIGTIEAEFTEKEQEKPAAAAPTKPGREAGAGKPADGEASAATPPVSRPVPSPEPKQAATSEPVKPSASTQQGERAAVRGAAAKPKATQPDASSAKHSGVAASPAYDATLDALDEFDRKPERAGRQNRARPEARRRGASRFVSLVVLLVFLGLVGFGGYALWLNKEPLIAALGLDEADQPAAAGGETVPPPESPSEEEPASGNAGEPSSGDKEDVRLNQSGETVPGQQDDDAAGEAPASTSPVREAGEPAPSGGGQASGGEPSVQVNPVGESRDGTEDQAQPSTSAETGAPARTEPSAPPAIAQKAFLYEEGSAGGGATRDNAAIVWSLVEEPPADGMPAEAVIRGQFDVPGRGLTMQLNIKRNTDEALPASHIIELLFDTPPDFSGGSIDNVARFVMKSSEQARGEGLVAVPAKIDTGYFLIALNNLAQAVETNRKLLLDSTWIDIPVGYTSGRRALVTLEKGAIGDKVFRDAFADWDNR